MSLKTKISLLECDNIIYTGLVGISSHDNQVYFWHLKSQQSQCILTIYQVNPLVPTSWRVFKEIIVDEYAHIVFASFNASCSKMAFIFLIANEFLIVDMSSRNTETRPMDRFLHDVFVFEFAETAVGWVAVFPKKRKVYCCKMFPQSEENQILLTLAPEDSHNYTSIGLTYDSFMYIAFSNNLCKVVSYDFLSANSTELAFAQWHPDMYMHYPFLIGAFDRSYLIRPPEHVGQGNRIFKVQQDHLGITLTQANQLDDQFLVENHDLAFRKAGNDKIAVIHPFFTGPKFLTVTHLGVPSLKSLAVWAVQKHHGTIGEDGELLDGISEEELKKSIGYQQNIKLF